VRAVLAALLVSCGTSAPADTPERAPPIAATAPVPPERAPRPPAGESAAPTIASAPAPSVDRAAVVAAHEGKAPHGWGTSVEDVATRLAGDERRIALTFDACGGPGGDGYDHALVELLRREAIPATLFVTARWIASHRDVAASLAADPLFELENHGSKHKPCSVSGRAAFGLVGTRSVKEAADEILGGADAIAAITSRRPRYYRSGAAHFDDVCAAMARELGAVPVGYSVGGDAGGGFTRAQIRRAIETAPDGSIVLLHMNHPGRSTAEGLADALPVLRERGVELVKLGDVELR
jgi:peptidoglycan/xylan/chitin deacetylase (PgdA/CDA1 family)